MCEAPCARAGKQEAYDRLFALAADRLLEVPVIDTSELSRRLGFAIADGEPLFMLIQHVISTEIDQAYEQMKVSLEAVRELGIKTVAVHSVADNSLPYSPTITCACSILIVESIIFLLSIFSAALI